MKTELFIGDFSCFSFSPVFLDSNPFSILIKTLSIEGKEYRYYDIKSLGDDKYSEL